MHLALGVLVLVASIALIVGAVFGGALLMFAAYAIGKAAIERLLGIKS